MRKSIGKPRKNYRRALPASVPAWRSQSPLRSLHSHQPEIDKI
nr:MAG TPA: hypothetical protein [Caudoviricetes sp.]